MATLTNPINAQSIVDRFADFVVNTANAGIVYGTNALPTVNWDAWSENGYSVAAGSYTFTGTGGPTSGITNPVTGASIKNTNSEVISAAKIVSALVDATKVYTSIRKVRYRLTVTATGGQDGNRAWVGGGLNPQQRNAGTIGPGGLIFDTTQVSNRLAKTTLPTPTVGLSGVLRVTTLEAFFQNLKDKYNEARDTVEDVSVTICHSSCHYSCHNSRGRR